MTNLKTQLKRFLSTRLSRRIMDQMVGLNEENKELINEKAKYYSAKLVKAYLKAIKQQQKILKEENTGVEKLQVIKQPLYIEPAVLAS